jgi:lipoic acid synthetase
MSSESSSSSTPGKAPVGSRERFAHRVQPTRKPDWIRMELPGGENFQDIRELLAERSLHTVCQEANCPNLGECWRGGTATMMVLGETCTRGCRFCAVRTGDPGGLLDADEPRKVAEAVELMKLRYVVLTSVDRDDLPDGGAGHFAQCVREIKALADKEGGAEVLVECLVPDFQGDVDAIRTLAVDAGLDVFAHNVETVERLTPKVRDKRCGYEQSLEVLRVAKELNPDVVTKTSIMLGLGETERELDKCFERLREVGCEVLTLGQYLRPSMLHLPVKEYVTPARFRALEQRALRYGFAYVAAGPMVRSSYKAAEFYLESRLGRERSERAAT